MKITYVLKLTKEITKRLKYFVPELKIGHCLSEMVQVFSKLKQQIVRKVIQKHAYR